MINQNRKFNKGFLLFNKGERIAIISLLTLIVIFLGFSIFRPIIQFSKNDRLAFQRLDSLLAMQDVMTRQQTKGKTMTHSEKSDTPIQTNEKHEKRETRKKPNQSLPKSDQVQNNDHPISTEKNTTVVSKTNNHTIDLNKADSTELLVLPQIGATMASRIQRYRNRLGGFVSMQQLFEIKGMDSARFETIKPYIVLNECNPQKINVNHDEFKVLLRHPYLEYEQVKTIVNHRDKKGMITDWDQLNSIVRDLNPLLEPYLNY